MRRTRLVALLLAALVALAACSDDSAEPAGGATPGSTTSSTGAAGTTITRPAADEIDVQIVDHPDLGAILVTGEGRTLYAFAPDAAEGEPFCTAACADAWPPLSAEPAANVPPPGRSPDPSRFSVTEHPDTGPQLVFDGWPLYLFSGDSRLGDTNGHGSGGVWFVVGPDGPVDVDG